MDDTEDARVETEGVGDEGSTRKLPLFDNWTFVDDMWLCEVYTKDELGRRFVNSKMNLSKIHHSKHSNVQSPIKPNENEHGRKLKHKSQSP